MIFATRGSAIFYLLVGVSFLAILFVLPYPHYQLDDNQWYLGTSLGSRMLGEEDPGVPLDQVARKVSSAAVTSPFEISCETNADCRAYVVTNQCKVYCGNQAASNKAAQVQLESNRACDPAAWAREAISCSCVAGKCINLK